MNLKDLITIIPELLLLVVPGFIALRIKEKYNVEKKRDDFDSTIYCFLYSFIIGIAYSALTALLIKLSPGLTDFLAKETVKQAAYLLLSVLLGLLLVKLPRSGIGRAVTSLFNKHMSPETTVWLEAMKNDKGAWAIVYLKNGMIYTGKLINYSTDPADEKRSLLLYNYRLSIRNDGSKTAADFCYDITDRTGDDNAKVFLSWEDIISIEILKDK